MKRGVLVAAVAALLLVIAPGAKSAPGPVDPAGRTVKKHVMLPLDTSAETAKDCAAPLVVSVTCVGYGTPMNNLFNGAIQTAPKVYIVHWGWHGNDPKGVGPRQIELFQHIGGSGWNATQGQYCDATGDTGMSCDADSHHVGNPRGVFAGAWEDNANPVPDNLADGDIEAEAVRAAAHFKRTDPNVQYVIDTPTGHSLSGFGTEWCAWHAATAKDNISYTYMGYLPDAGTSCGGGYVHGDLDGVSIVGGHEFAESETDPHLDSWRDPFLAENADKCAWIQIGPGSIADVTLSDGVTLPMQALWSNTANGGRGGCVMG